MADLAHASTATGVSVGELKCEYRVDPLGIDVTAPRLSWTIESEERGQIQTAYQVLVAGTDEALSQDTGDLWDSGRVDSDQSVHVVYAGRPLKSRESCYWKVRVWDKNGNASAWSQPAFWSMGLLDPSDWKAKWIGLDEGDQPDYLADAQWLRVSEEGQGLPRFFRRTVAIPEGGEISAARLIVGTNCSFSVYVNGRAVVERMRTVFAPSLEMDVRPYLQTGSNAIAISVEPGQNDKDPRLICSLSVEFESGDPVVVRSDAAWEVSDRQDGGWSAAEVLGPNDGSRFDRVLGNDCTRLPARMLRREFSVDRKVKRATAYMCGLGFSELCLNGRKVGDRVLSPGLTDYRKRALYVNCDVTDELRHGLNAVGVILGNGRFFAPRKVACSPAVNFGFPKLLFQMEIEYDDGTIETVTSDDSWKLTADGPIRENNEYDGEAYDARKEIEGWSEPGFVEDERWQAAKLVDGPTGVLNSEMAEPMRVVETVRPVAITSPSPGVYVFDLGQNIAGWCRLTVKGPAGTRVRLRHAERLLDDGNLRVDNLRTAKATDVYILSGKGTEVYEPRFVYHGFRYVEVTGFPGAPTLSDLEGKVVCDALDRAGEFSCSNALINKIYHNMYWGFLGNYKSIPMDCPQRDERQGWFGDRCEVARGEMYIFDTAAFDTKWLRDIRDSQLDDGRLPDIAPAYWSFYSQSITFPSILTDMVGYLYTEYADTRAIEANYDCMRKWVDMEIGRLSDGIMPPDTYGDWCSPPERPELIRQGVFSRATSQDLVSTAFFHHDLGLMARHASILGKAEDEARFIQAADRIKAAFNAKFLDEETGAYDKGSQTSSILPLAFGLTPDSQRQRVFENLVRNICDETDHHLSVGQMGCKWLMRTLTDNGRPDLAYKLATQTTYPSWGYMIEQDATTIWELWNGDVGNAGMNSFNHVMQIGDLLLWLHQHVTGIAPDEQRPGFKHIIMRPSVVGDLKSARAQRKSMYGTILSDWKIRNGAFEWRIEIPANATATIYVPATDSDSVLEGGEPATAAAGVKFLRMEGDRAVFEVGSGRYVFTSPS